MPPPRRFLLFDLFGVIAKHQRTGAMAQMAACCGAAESPFTEAYWACRRAYDAGHDTPNEYWTSVLQRVGRPADADTIEQLRLADIDSWSDLDDDMVDYVQALHQDAEIGVLSNIPADHADSLLNTHPWLQQLDLLALSGRIGLAKPDPAAFEHCLTRLAARPADILFVDDRDDNIRAAGDLGLGTHHFTGIRQLKTAIDSWLPHTNRPTPLTATSRRPRSARLG